MKSNKDILTEMVNDTMLESDEMNLWQSFINVSTDENLAAVIEMIKSDENGLQLLTQNLQAKVAAMQSGDPDALKHIEQVETQMVEEADK